MLTTNSRKRREDKYMRLTKSGAVWGGKKGRSGRKPGGFNTRSRQIAADAAAKGITPLEYMLAIMRDENEVPQRRDTMALHAAPFIHPKLNSVSAPSGGPIEYDVKITFVEPGEV